MNIIIIALIGAILLFVSLKLEAETSGKDSAAYKRFKKVGIIGLTCTWGGIIALGLMLILINNL